MAEFTHDDLKSERESHKVRRWELAKAIGVSEETIKRWEYGTQRPDPDDIGNIERFLQSPGLWHKWMMSHYDSYRERHGDVPDGEHLITAIVRMKHEMSDVMKMLDDVEQDALDGALDDPALKRKLRKEALEAQAAIQQTLDRIPDDA